MTTATSPARPDGWITRRLGGRVAVVSGAASGIGRAIALRLADEGAAVVCGDLRPEPVAGGLDGDEPTDALVRARGGRASFVTWDIRSADEGAAAFDLARREYGRVDIVVANAGVAVKAKQLPDEEITSWQPQLDINLTGTWNTVRLGLKALIEQGDGGRIITLSSIAGLVGLPGLASGYGVTKAGIIQLTRQAAATAAPYGITANAVCPGYVRTAINPGVWRDADALTTVTSLHPLARLGEAVEVAGAVAFLASDDAAWITGVALPVDGGMTSV